MSALPSPRWWRIVDVLAILVVAGISLMALKPEQMDFIVRSSWAGFSDVLPETAWAAVKVWTFWGLTAAILAGYMLRLAPDLGLLDSLIAGVAGVWILAYVGGNLLGPIGLLRAWLIWPVLLVAGWSLWQRPPPISRPRMSPGQRLLVLIFVLVAPTTLLLQLGCPVPPFMDIFATPAAAQRIITFGRYLPFDNDPYGYWDAGSQLPGLELFYALLGIGSHTSLALLADTAAILPMTGLLMLATYRYGRTVAGDVAGGFAAMFLAATILLRVLPVMHGRVTAFAMVGVGLAFVLDERRSAVRMTLGALALATAFSSHAAVGSLGMGLAGLSVLWWLLGGNLYAFLGGCGVMVGTVLLAFPTVAVCTRMVLPYPILPLTQLIGLGIAFGSARWLQGKPIVQRAAPLQWLFVLYVAYVLLRHPSPYLPNNHPQRFPLLVYGGGMGFVLSLWEDRAAILPWRWRATSPRDLGLASVALGLAIAMAAEYFYSVVDWRGMFPDPRAQVAISSFYWKVDYWIPYVLVYPTGYLAAWLYERTSNRGTVLLVLLLLLFPWRERWLWPIGSQGFADPNYHQHALAEAWAYQTENGKAGYWGGTPDRRWAQSAAELAASQVLRDEIAAGRITVDTHIAHLGPLQYLYKDNFLLSVYTGINDDGYITNYQFDWSIAGGRLHPIEEWPARLATKPSYIAIHTRNDPSQPDNVDPLPYAGDLSGYAEIFNHDGVRLYRNEGPFVADSK